MAGLSHNGILDEERNTMRIILSKSITDCVWGSKCQSEAALVERSVQRSKLRRPSMEIRTFKFLPKSLYN